MAKPTEEEMVRYTKMFVRAITHIDAAVKHIQEGKHIEALAAAMVTQKALAGMKETMLGPVRDA